MYLRMVLLLSPGKVQADSSVKAWQGLCVVSGPQ